MGTHANRFHRCLLAGLPALLIALLPVVATARPPLYERMGGAQKITALVDEYVQVLSSDRRTRRAFDKTDLKRIKREFAAQLCELTDGHATIANIPDGDYEMHAWHPGVEAEPKVLLIRVSGTTPLTRAIRLPARSIAQLRRELATSGAH